MCCFCSCNYDFYLFLEGCSKYIFGSTNFKRTDWYLENYSPCESCDPLGSEKNSWTYQVNLVAFKQPNLSPLILERFLGILGVAFQFYCSLGFIWLGDGSRLNKSCLHDLGFQTIIVIEFHHNCWWSSYHLGPCKFTKILPQLVTWKVMSGRGMMVVLYRSTYLPLLTRQVASCSKNCVNLRDLSVYIFKIMKERDTSLLMLLNIWII